jgi:hypothetical protein
VSVDERAAVVVIRLWLEGPAPEGVRARVTAHRIAPAEESISQPAATIDEAVELARGWLADFVTRG